MYSSGLISDLFRSQIALRALSVSSTVFFLSPFLLLDVHDDRVLDEVGVLLDDRPQPPGVEELLRVLLQVQDDVGAARRLLDRLDGELALAVGLPAARRRSGSPAMRETTVTLSATMNAE